MVPVIFVPEVLVVAPGQLMVPIIAEPSTERHDELTCHVPTTSPPHALAVPQPPPESLSEPPHAVRYKALKPMSPTNKFLMRTILTQRVRALECKIVHSAARSSLLPVLGLRCQCSVSVAYVRLHLPMFGFICLCPLTCIRASFADITRSFLECRLRSNRRPAHRPLGRACPREDAPFAHFV